MTFSLVPTEDKALSDEEGVRDGSRLATSAGVPLPFNLF